MGLLAIPIEGSLTNSCVFSNRWLRVVLKGRYLQKYWVNAGFPQGSMAKFFPL